LFAVLVKEPYLPPAFLDVAARFERAPVSPELRTHSVE